MPEAWEKEERREAAEGAESVDGRDLLPGVDSDDEDLGEDALYHLAMEWSSDFVDAEADAAAVKESE